jgi:hypothetical protein
VLSGIGRCDELITRPEESYQLWCIVVWSRNLVNEAMAHGGGVAQKTLRLTKTQLPLQYLHSSAHSLHHLLYEVSHLSDCFGLALPFSRKQVVCREAQL